MKNPTENRQQPGRKTTGNQSRPSLDYMTPSDGRSLSGSVGPLFKRSYDSSIGRVLTSSSSEEGWGRKRETQLEQGLGGAGGGGAAHCSGRF